MVRERLYVKVFRSGDRWCLVVAAGFATRALVVLGEPAVFSTRAAALDAKALVVFACEVLSAV